MVVVSVGVKQAQETLRTETAVGADRATLVTDADNIHTEPISNRWPLLISSPRRLPKSSPVW